MADDLFILRGLFFLLYDYYVFFFIPLDRFLQDHKQIVDGLIFTCGLTCRRSRSFAQRSFGIHRTNFYGNTGHSVFLGSRYCWPPRFHSRHCCYMDNFPFPSLLSLSDHGRMYITHPLFFRSHYLIPFDLDPLETVIILSMCILPLHYRTTNNQPACGWPGPTGPILGSKR